MNLNIYLNELKRGLLSLIIWCVSISAIIVFGMAFFPVLNHGDMLRFMNPLFENPMMKGLMSAFGVSLESLTNILGFYVAYGSIYTILVGAIFAALLGSKLISAEENEKTSEFLLTRPVTRNKIVLSKIMVLLTQIFILNIVILIFSFISMEMFKPENPGIVYLSEAGRNEMVKTFEEEPLVFRDYFELTEEKYIEFFFSGIQAQMTEEFTAGIDINLDKKMLSTLMEDINKSPLEFISGVRADPEKYAAIFGLQAEEYGLFISSIDALERQLSMVREKLLSSPVLYIDIFKEDPANCLHRYKNDPKGFNDFKAKFGFNELKYSKVFIYYRADRLCVLLVYTFLFMILMGSIGLFISLLFKRGKAITGAVMGIVMVSYILDAFSKVSKEMDFIGYISPFKFININIISPDYGFDWWRILYFAGLSVFFLGLTILVYRKKDILV